MLEALQAPYEHSLLHSARCRSASNARYARTAPQGRASILSGMVKGSVRLERMIAPVSPPQGRDYSQLLGSMNELLAVLSCEGGEEAALRASFEAAARGFGAQKALLLVIEQPEPLRLRSIHI